MQENACGSFLNPENNVDRRMVIICFHVVPHMGLAKTRKRFIFSITSLTFIKLNKANINRCDSLSEMEQNQDLMSIGSLVLV